MEYTLTYRPDSRDHFSFNQDYRYSLTWVAVLIGMLKNVDLKTELDVEHNIFE
jgi:hypothetical protein